MVAAFRWNGPVLGLAVGLVLTTSPDTVAQNPHESRSRAAAQRRTKERDASEILIEEALVDVLTAETEKDETDRFTDLVSAVNRGATRAGLPSFWEVPDNLYSDEYKAFRARWYGTLRKSEKGLALLHRLARVSGPSKYNEMTAVMFLADDPTLDDVRAMIDGLNATESKASHRTSRCRHLGRAIRNLEERGDPAAQPLIDEALAFFHEHIENGPNYDKGGAIEGLYRAGHQDEAVVALRDILNNSETSEEALDAIQSCPRLLKMEGFDPFLKAKAVAVAREAAEIAVVEALEKDPLTRSVSNAASTVRGSIDFLRDVSPETQLDFFLNCYEDRAITTVLGMDGIQNVRYALQQGRKSLSGDEARRMDQAMLDILVEAGDRLWAMEEEPMTEAEWKEFHATRDLRYNAGYYFVALWDKETDVRNVIADDPDIGEFLKCLVRAEDLIAEGEGADALYTQVRDKDETRLLSGMILAHMEQDLGVECDDLDLYELFVGFVAQEVFADQKAVNASMQQQVEIGSTDLLLEIPVVKKPWDAWIKNKAVDALEILGCEVIDGSKRVQVRLPEAGGAFATAAGQ